MTDERTIADVEREYKEYLKGEDGSALAEVGRRLMVAWEITKEDYERKGLFWTKSVREAYLPDAWKGIAKKVAIHGFGTNNCCSPNAIWVEENFGWDMVWGFNISACRCGGRMTLEPHALNRHPDGSYVDITADYQGETEKWFFPVENPSFGFLEYNERYDGMFVVYQPACSCLKLKQKWDNGGKIVFGDEDEIVGWVEEMKQYPKCAIRRVLAVS